MSVEPCQFLVTSFVDSFMDTLSSPSRWWRLLGSCSWGHRYKWWKLVSFKGRLGSSLRDKVRCLFIRGGLGVKPLLLNIRRSPTWCLLAEVFQAYRTGMRHQVIPRICWRDYICQLTWEQCRGGQGEGSLGFSTKTAAPASQTWMQGCNNIAFNTNDNNIHSFVSASQQQQQQRNNLY